MAAGAQAITSGAAHTATRPECAAPATRSTERIRDPGTRAPMRALLPHL